MLKARVRRAEGWPVGVAMSLRPLPEDIEIGSLRGSGGPEGVVRGARQAASCGHCPPMLSDFSARGIDVRASPRGMHRCARHAAKHADDDRHRAPQPVRYRGCPAA
ncbi:MAG: hypothetical protein HND48_15860 [Chloroflexi bacterium]|nr:hypothetical protein [Chloroflexota bacterium]